MSADLEYHHGHLNRRHNMPVVKGEDTFVKIKGYITRVNAQQSVVPNWIGIDFSILPPYKEAEEGYIPSDEEYDEEHEIALPDDVCTHCFTKLKWINLYYQCTDCKRIYG